MLFIYLLQAFVGLIILNVWIFRVNRETDYRGGDAKNMQEEFAVYGLPLWFMRLVCVLKIGFAALLIAGIWLPSLAVPSAIGMAGLMLGAFLMHLKVKDSLNKTYPSFLLLLFCLTIVCAHLL